MNTDTTNSPTPDQTAKRVIELSEKATKGPWMVDKDAWPPELSVVDRDCIVVTTVTNEHSRDPVAQLQSQRDNMTFIAECRTAAPELARAYLELETELQQLRLAADGMRDEVEKAPHGHDCALGQPVTRFGRPPGSRGDMPCNCWKSKALAAYRAAGEGTPKDTGTSRE